MDYLVENTRAQIDLLLSRACEKAGIAGRLPAGLTLAGSASASKEDIAGDWAASHAMVSAKLLKMPPRAAAEILLEYLELDGSFFKCAEAAGPGFINFTLADNWYAAVLSAIESEGRDYGRINAGRGERVMVEFVSANPTGPMTIGNARGGVVGDVLASVLDRAGYSVSREFYVNDEGNQIELFARSIEARYLELIGREDSAFPEEGYHGEDIRQLAGLIRERDGDIYADMPQAERRAAFADFALPYNLSRMKEHLERYGIRYDTWFRESSLHSSGSVRETLDFLTKAGYTYEKDGAVWLRNTALGADKDEVLLRANGFYTYYAADIAYHRNKFFERGFDRVIDVLGADHHGHAIRFKATMSAPEMGMDGKRLDFLIMQMVRLMRGGEMVKVSKRTGRAITLNDLLDEIDVDACRFFFNAKPDTHLDFDMDLAVRRDSENPVYYVQYAHARICTMIALILGEGGRIPAAAEVDAALLSTKPERELIKQLALLPEEIRLAARDYDPSRLNRYTIELAARFHKFYAACKIRGAEPDCFGARLKLADCVRRVVANCLEIIGVTAPEKM